MNGFALHLICLIMAMPLAPAKGQAASNPPHDEPMKKADATLQTVDEPFKWLRTNLIGNVYGKLTVIGFAGRNPKNGRSMWECVCECGVKKAVGGRPLLTGSTRSCGCLKSEVTIERNTIHGHTSANDGCSPEYNAWRNLIERCDNPNMPNYHCYGGRGIQVCPEWRDFSTFLADMGPRPSKVHSIERVDNHKGYEPSNCIWGTRYRQNRNKRNNVYLADKHGRVNIQADWFRIIGEYKTETLMKSGELKRVEAMS